MRMSMTVLTGSFARAAHPLPTSPVEGEVPLRAWRSIVPVTPAGHLPLDGGGWVGVCPALIPNDTHQLIQA
jgi:hypothetical protein